MAESMEFAKRLREARERQGLKQKELAEKACVTPQTISAYEKAGKLPPLDKASIIANALGVSLNWLVSGEDQQVQEVKTAVDYISDIFEAVDELGLTFCEETDWNGNPNGEYIIRLKNEKLRGFHSLISDLHKLKEVRSVLEPDDYKTLVCKKIKSRAAESNNFESISDEFVEIGDEDGELPF